MAAIATQFPSLISVPAASQNSSFWAAVGLESSGLNESPHNLPEGEILEIGIDHDSLPTRRSLLSRLRNVEDNESWRTFFDTYWRLLYNVARKSGLSDHHAQDVVQETVIAVARKIPEFRYNPTKGSFKQWLLLICRRRIQDHFRRIYSVSASLEQQSQDNTRAAENVPDPVLRPDAQIDEIWEQEWRDNVYRGALLKVRQRVNPKQYQVFDCCVLQEQRPAEVARMLGMNVAQVYLAKHRVTAAVKQAVKELESQLSDVAD
jgi:RNA polymerase sigma factor (sigma-70 family)